MNFNEFKDILFQKAKEAGFSEYELYHVGGDSFKLAVYQGEVDNCGINTFRGVSFRAIYNEKMGYAYTEVLDQEAIELLIKTAKENAIIIENEDKEVIYQGDDNYKDIQAYYSKLNDVETDDKLKIALDMEKAAFVYDSRVTNVKSCSIHSFNDAVNIVNSKGLNLSYKTNGMFAVVSPVVKDGDKVNTAYAYKMVTDFNHIDAEKLAKEAVDKALAYIGAAPVASGKYKVILDNEAATDLLESYSVVFSAERVQKGMSLLKGKVGTNIASDKLTIIDDPHLKGGWCSCPFDAEGVATYTEDVIKDGKLITLLYNLKSALKDGVKTTGNASKSSYSSPVKISPFNFYVKPGDIELDKMMQIMGDGLYITELQGLHSGANTVSGDFSLAAKGFLINKGKIERSVDQITVAGNFYKLLFDIVEIANDLKFGMPSGAGCCGSPSIMIKELSVAGN